MASGPYLFAAWQCARRPQPDSGKLAAVKHHQITAPQSRNSPVARDCVVDLVGLDPTTRVLWNAGVSDQLTLSNTRYRQQPHHGEVVGARSISSNNERRLLPKCRVTGAMPGVSGVAKLAHFEHQ